MKSFNRFRLVMLLMFVAIVITGCGKKVQALDFYEIEIYGMNNYGKAKVIASRDELARAIAESVKISENSMEGMTFIESYMNRIEYNLEPNENLKNGDTVILTMEYHKGDNDKVKIIGGEKKLKVKDLPEGKVLDIFQDVEVKFSGVSPAGKAEVVNNSKEDFVKNIDFTIEPSSNLKTGDKVKLLAEYDEDLAIEKLFIVESDTKEYIVDKLDSYLDKASLFDNETKKNILKEANDIVEAHVADTTSHLYDTFGKFGYSFSNQDYEYKFKFNQANFLVTKSPKLSSFELGHNQLVLFYEVEVKLKKENEIARGYISVVFKDIIMHSDGEIDIDFSDGKVVMKLKRKGDIEREHLTKYKDHYLIETVDFKVE